MAEQVFNNNEQQNENTKKPEAAKQLDADKKGINLFFGEKERKLFLSLMDIPKILLRKVIWWF